jgi:translation initiation factor 2 subunit 2
MDDYEKLLTSAFKKVEKIEGSSERFEIPKIEGRFEGKKTILTNFFTISEHLRRDSNHFQKFILKELAASGQKEGDRLIINKRVPSTKINEKIKQYAEEFVICKECQKPDTEILKEKRINFLHCLACGAKHPIRGRI